MKCFKEKIKFFLKKGGLFAILVIITFIVIGRKIDIDLFIEMLKEASYGYLFLGFFAMFIYVSCEALNLKRILELLGTYISMGDAYYFAMVGFFFSGITPSASGGQPMQLYYMQKQNIDMGKAALALILELSSFQIVAITLGILGMILEHEYMDAQLGGMKWFFTVGIFANFLVLCVLLSLAFSKKATRLSFRFLNFIFSIFKVKNSEGKLEVVKAHITEYEQGAEVIKQNKLFMIKTLLITFLENTSAASVVFWMYKAIGVDGDMGFTSIILIQGVLFVGTSAVPLPGGVGISETAFSIIYKSIFIGGFMVGGLLLTRFVNFYLLILLCGVVIGVRQLSQS